MAVNPSLIVHPHVLTGDGRVAEVAEFRPRETLARYIERTGIVVPAGPVAVWHNGRRVPDAIWRHLIPRTGDQVIIRSRALGGGGDGNKVLRTVMMIVVIIVSIYAGPAVGASLGVSSSTGSMIVMMAGSMLVNAMLPPLIATADALGSGAKYDASPTYALTGGGNRMRPWEPMTLVFGRHKVVPDLGAKYYTEYVGDTQYLNQVFHFGLQAGQLDLTNFRIGSTPIENYQDVQIQVSGADGKLSMFAGNVDTLDGFVLESGVVNSRTTERDATAISVDLAAQLYSVNDNGSMSGMTVELRVQYRKVGAPDWIDIGVMEDAIYATHYWSLQKNISDENGGSWQQVEFGSTNFSDHVPGDTVTVGQVCNGSFCRGGETMVWHWVPHPSSITRGPFGQYKPEGMPWVGVAPDPLIGYSTLPGVRIYGAKQEPTRKTVTWEVEKGQYEIRVWKVTSDVKSSRSSNETAVSQIRVYQTDEADYTGQLRVALRIKATSQLNGAVDQFNAMAQAHAPVWAGDHFDYLPTRSPAWNFLLFAKGKVVPGKGRIYGAGLPDSKIDLDAIRAWAAWCDEKGLTFDYVLDRKMSCDDALRIIARAGRASPTRQTGRLGVVWDAADLPHVGMFGPFNIKAGSFRVDYINEGTVDEVVVNFANAERDYAMDEVRVRVPGATTTNNPLQLDMDGCTSHVLAGAEANLIAASQVWHRRRVSWETDIEGWIANRGSVVQISHDLTVWGYSGRLLGRAGNALTLSQHLPTGSGTMMLRGPENQMRTVVVAGGYETDTVTITSDMSGFPLPGDEGYEDVPAMDWAWFFDPLATPGRRFKIVEVRPTEDGVKFSAIDDDPGYYASESDPYIYTPPRDGALLGGIIFGTTITESIVNVLADLNAVQIGWALSTAMPVDVVVTTNGMPAPAVRAIDRKITLQAQTGDVLDISLTPVSAAGGGQPKTQTYTVRGLTAPLPELTGLTSVFRDGLTVLTWRRVVDVRQPEYEVRIGDSWANARTLAVTPNSEVLSGGNGLYWVAARYARNGSVIYGAADSLLVSGAALVRNVLVNENEGPGWTGDLGDGAYIHNGELTLRPAGDVLAAPDVLAAQDILWFGGAQASGSYTSPEIIDVGFVAPVRIDFTVDAYAFNFGQDMLAMVDVLSNPDVLNGSDAQFWRAVPQYRAAGDDGVFGPWVDFVPGLINARRFQTRLRVQTDDPLIVPFVRQFSWLIDVPDLLQGEEGVAIPSAGLRIGYEKHFHALPNVQITVLDAAAGDRYVLTGPDETGFTIRLYNGTAPITGIINWLSQGY